MVYIIEDSHKDLNVNDKPNKTEPTIIEAYGI